MIAILLGFALLDPSGIDTTGTSIIFDRPGIADSPYILPSGTFQGEFGIVYNNVFGIEESYLPAFLGRIPLSGKAELRVGLNYEPQSVQFITQNFQENHDPLSLGFKYNLSKKKQKPHPEFAFCGNVFTPLQQLGNREAKYHADFYLLIQHNFNKTHELNLNLGIAYFSNLSSTTFPLSFCYNLNIDPKWTLFLEGFTYYFEKSNKWDSGWDTGIVWQFHEYLQVDFSWIQNRGLYQNLNFFGLGFSFNTRILGH